ncbi:hypothetical protein L7F22_032334, partial [Adiantum nelumboides]|nr:hypothetical protein [Adiantum nelumboides]
MDGKDESWNLKPRVELSVFHDNHRKVPELNVVVTADVERHWVEGEVHALEMEFYQQKEHKACKGLWDKLREEETSLKLAIEKKKASVGSVSPAEGMRVPFVGSLVDIGASSPPAATDNLTKVSNLLSSVDSDFIVLGICALVLIGGTLYFWFKDDGRDDNGDSGGGEKVRNHVPSMYNSEAFHSRVITVHFFSEKEPLEAGRLASTLLRYCIWYGTCNKADGKGLKALGYHLLTESNLSQLSERAGFRLYSMEVLKKVYDRLPAASRSRYLKWFERFDNAAKAQLYLPRDEAEYAKKVALYNPGGEDPEVELIKLALQVEREMEGKGLEQEQRALSLEELDLEQQELSEPKQ